jgi:hypothetical protein
MQPQVKAGDEIIITIRGTVDHTERDGRFMVRTDTGALYVSPQSAQKMWMVLPCSH